MNRLHPLNTHLRRGLAMLLATSLILLSGCQIKGPAYQSIVDGGEWFLNNQDGSFIYYEYDPIFDIWSDSHHSMREIGGLWSIALLRNFLDDERYDELLYKGFWHFEPHFAHDELSDFHYLNITPHKIKLGYNAFLILVLLEIEHEEKDELLEQFADGILYQQEASGELRTFFYSDRDTGVDYYPGQSLLALMSLYEYNGDSRYLEAVQKAFPYYRNYWRQNPNTAFVPWQTQAYFKLYQQTQDPDVADFIFEMNDYITHEHSEYPEFEDYCGVFDFSDGIVTAVYVEGANKAYELADELGDGDRKRCYRSFIRDGLDAVMALQFPLNGQDPADYAPAAWGGFFGKKSDLTMRVDRNQHAVMALMGAYELGLVR